jgi:hypothetical protein
METRKDRRTVPRTEVSQLVRIRPFDPNFPTEYCTTFNVSRNGVYFATSAAHYLLGINVYVTRDFLPGDPMNREEMGTVVRVEKLEDYRFGIAIRFFSGA